MIRKEMKKFSKKFPKATVDMKKVVFLQPQTRTMGR